MAFSAEELGDKVSLKPRGSDNLVDINFLSLLFYRFSKITGMKFSQRSQNPSIFYLLQPFNDTDLMELPMKVKFPNIIHFAEGFFYEVKGLTSRVEDPESSRRFYFMAIEKFEDALDSNPNNKEILVNVALTWTLILEEEFLFGQQFPRDHPCVFKAIEYYLRAISAIPKYDSLTLFLYAYFLERCGKYQDAEDYYLQSLEANPENIVCLLQYGNFLQERGFHKEAEQFLRFSTQRTKGFKAMEWNYFS